MAVVYNTAEDSSDNLHS